MFVRPTNFGHLSDNHDVNVSGLLNNQFLVYDSGTDYWQPSSGLYYVDGDLGIGTASPSYKLDVNGTFSANSINVNDEFTFPTTDGTANQVLQTDGEGTLSFTGAPTFTALTVDTNTLYVDATNNRIGIGTTSPAYQVEIENNGANALLVLDRTDGASTFIEGSNTASVIGSVGANDVKIAYNSVPVVTIGSGGAITTSGNITGGTLRANNFTTQNAFVIVGSDNNLIQDTTLSVDPASNFLGINQTSPEVTLHMTGEDAQTAQIRMEQYNNSADAPDIRTRRYRGTAAEPAAVQAGDYLFRSNHEYYNGTSLLVGGAFAFDNTNNANRTQFSVAVDTDGNGANPQGNNGQFKIDGNDSGAITFNNAYKFPTTDGSANQVLKTNGSGILSWADDSTAAGGGGIDGTGIANYVSKWADSDSLTSGIIYDDGTNVGIGTASPQAKLDVNGTVQFDDLVRWEYPDKILDTNIGTLGYLRPYDEAGAYCGLGVSASSFNIGTSGAINTRFIGQGVERAIFDTNGNFIFNDNGNNCDFRIEGDTDQNLFFCDASSDNIGIGTNSPNSQAKLHIYNTNSNYIYQQILGGNNFGTMTLMNASVNQTINIINGIYSYMFPTTNGSVAGFYHFRVDPPSGLGSMTTQVGYLVGPGMKYATNNFAYRGQLPDGPNNNWNLYNDGSAPNYMAGSFGVGTTTLPYKLNINGDIGLTDSGFYASPTGVMVGTSGWLYNDGQTTLSHGNFSDNGDAQNSSYVLRTSTTNATFTTIANNGSSIRLSNNRTFMFTANIVARRTNGQDNAAYKLEGIIANDGYGASILGTPVKTILYESDSSWDVQAIITSINVGSDTSDDLLIQAKGAASKNINWVCKLDLLEAGGDISGYTELNALNINSETIP
jgi:hypothetical protein